MDLTERRVGGFEPNWNRCRWVLVRCRCRFRPCRWNVFLRSSPGHSRGFRYVHVTNQPQNAEHTPILLVLDAFRLIIAAPAICNPHSPRARPAMHSTPPASCCSISTASFTPVLPHPPPRSRPRQILLPAGPSARSSHPRHLNLHRPPPRTRIRITVLTFHAR